MCPFFEGKDTWFVSESTWFGPSFIDTSLFSYPKSIKRNIQLYLKHSIPLTCSDSTDTGKLRWCHTFICLRTVVVVMNCAFVDLITIQRYRFTSILWPSKAWLRREHKATVIYILEFRVKCKRLEEFCFADWKSRFSRCAGTNFVVWEWIKLLSKTNYVHNLFKQ